MTQRWCITVSGRVQGVGFRPTICRRAQALGLAGGVMNHVQGVKIEVQGPPDRLEDFLQSLRQHAPRNARLDSIQTEEIPVRSETDFRILASQRSGELLAGLPPDLATCDECRQEILDPANRRFGYAFTNCTNCGPRFTIVEKLPYDRPFTAMKGFALCPACGREYANPSDRRFDAQPNACPACGPRLAWTRLNAEPLPGNPLEQAALGLRSGVIVAIKGVGGYHLACDACSEQAVARLRNRKNRPAKALAVMFASLAELEQYCFASDEEKNILTSPGRPVVILRQRLENRLSSTISPDSRDVGAFLPYTPLHHLLLQKISPLVMTSANRSDEPIVIAEQDLEPQLTGIADYALTHNRPILRRCDDSVVKMVTGMGPLFFRRSRGYVPDPVALPFSGPSVLACGGQMKNTFCLTRADQAVLSQHIGDLDDPRAMQFLEEQIRDLTALLGSRPVRIAFDQHPDYQSTRWAQASDIPVKVPVQHHHAHIAACMAENGLTGKVIGVAWDGTGFGPDRTVWGGEFLAADYQGFTRPAHLDLLPMPGGEASILYPERMAAAALFRYFPDWEAKAAKFLPSLREDERRNLSVLLTQPRLLQTSSAGRLFDVFAVLLGLGEKISYDGQAAVRFQAMADPSVTDQYPFALIQDPDQVVLSFQETLAAVMHDLDRACPKPGIAGKVHVTLAEAMLRTCLLLHNQLGLDRVALSGGVFQNDLLLTLTKTKLEQAGFKVYHHRQVPPNDGGLALGQAAVAMSRE